MHLVRGINHVSAIGRGGSRSVGLDGSDDIVARVTVALDAKEWECVVVGGGIRGPEEQVELFESVINLIRLHAPQAAIAFNTTLQDIDDAVARSLQPRGHMPVA